MLAIYPYQQGKFGQALAWASVDARQIAVSGWLPPSAGTYLALVDVASADRKGRFSLSLACDGGCGQERTCRSDADCTAGLVCWQGLCFEKEIECQDPQGFCAKCRLDSDCPSGQACVQGKCQAKCVPTAEICDRQDNDCDGLIDEDGVCDQCCDQCRSDRDCASGQVCQSGKCVAGCVPTTEICDRQDNDCDGEIDEGGVCGSACRTDRECPTGMVCVNNLCKAR